MNYNSKDYTGTVAGGVFSVTVPSRRGRAARRYHHLRRHRFRLRRRRQRRDPDTEDVHTTDTTAGTIALDEIAMT